MVQTAVNGREGVISLKQLTIRGIEPELRLRIRLEAARAGVSLNQAGLSLLRRGAGVTAGGPPGPVGAALDHLIGTWSEADERELLDAIALCECNEPFAGPRGGS